LTPSVKTATCKYCGAPAAIEIEVDGAVVFLCERHFRRLVSEMKAKAKESGSAGLARKGKRVVIEAPSPPLVDEPEEWEEGEEYDGGATEGGEED